MFGALDVTDVLSDPDLSGPFTVTRTVKGMDDNNRTTEVTQPPIAAFGSIQPTSSRDLIRLPDAERHDGAYTIWTTFALTSGDATYGADVVTVENRSFVVTSIDAWSYGSGYTKAYAALYDVG